MNTVAAVAHAVPLQTHSPGLSLGASAGNTNLRAGSKGSSAMVLPVRRCLRTKTPPIAQTRAPSTGAVRRRMPSKTPPSLVHHDLMYHSCKEEVLIHYLCGRKAPVPSTCDAVEALLRRELLSHLQELLSRKAGVLGCTSSRTILLMYWKEIFPNEDAGCLDLVDELHAVPSKMQTTMRQLASWLEDWVTTNW